MGKGANFTWDDGKDRENRRKHGLPLRLSELVLFDPQHLDLPTRLAVGGELRRQLIGEVGEQVLTCTYVWEERRRAISLRPASRKE